MTFCHYLNTTQLACDLTRLIWFRFRIQPLSLNTRHFHVACNFFVYNYIRGQEECSCGDSATDGPKKIFKFEIILETMKTDTENTKHECWCKTRATSKAADWKISRNTLNHTKFAGHKINNETDNNETAFCSAHAFVNWYKTINP